MMRLIIPAFGLLLAPFSAHAMTLSGVLEVFGGLVGMLTPIVVGAGLIAFFWGLANYIFSFNSDEKDKKKGRDIMHYGLITLFVMFSVWGLVRILQETFDLNSTGDNPQEVNLPYIIPPGDAQP